MNMTATVLEVNAQTLLVRDLQTGEEVVVNVRNPQRFSIGDLVLIVYSGQMTASIPPQITALMITKIGAIPQPPQPPRPPQPESADIRAVVLQTGTDFLIVRNQQTNQQMRVNYPYAHHFCPRQQVMIVSESIMFTDPPRVNASDIRPIC